MGQGPSPRPGRRRLLAVPAALTSALALAFDAGDAAAVQRRAQLSLKVSVVGGCTAASGTGGAAAVDTVCAAAVRPATLVEGGPAPAAVADPARPATGATAVTDQAGADGTQYLTLIY